jgi:hypothetical protein
MNIIRKIIIVLWCIIIPSTALGMKVSVGNKEASQLITLEVNMHYHNPTHEIYSLMHNAIDLLKLMMDKKGVK